MPDPNKQWSVNTARETSWSQSLPSQSQKGKVCQSHAAHDVMDKGEISRKNQVQQVVHKPYAASMPSKNHKVVRWKSGQIIHKPYRLGIDG